MAEWTNGTGALGRVLYRDGQAVGMVDSPEIALEIVAAMRVAERMVAERLPDAQRGGYPAGRSSGRLPKVPAGPAPGARERGRERSPEPWVADCSGCGRRVPLDGGGLFMPHTIEPDDPTGDWCQRSRRRP